MNKINLKKLREVGEKAKPHYVHSMSKSGIMRIDDNINKGKKITDDVDCVEFYFEARNNWEAIINALEEAKVLIENNCFEDSSVDEQSCYWLERF